MIEYINDFSANWFNYFLDIVIQNSIFLLFIFGFLFLIQSKNVRILRAILLISLIKLLIPPFISTNIIQEISPINIETVSVIPVSILRSNFNNVDMYLSIESIIFFVWILLVLTILLITIINTFRYFRKLRNPESINISKYNIRFNKSIKILKSKLYHSPFVIGIFKPKIVLPKNWDELTIEDKRIVLLHEYAHIFEKDNWINILKVIVQAVYFFNPLIWFLNKKLHRYSEMLCDDFAINALNSNQIKYSKHLIKISEMTTTLNGLGSKSLAFSESYKSIKDRINYQFKKKENYFMKKLNLKILFLLLIFSAAIIPFSWQCSIEEPAKVYEFFDVSKAPKIKHSVSPYFPEDARKDGLEGMVVITVTIDESGNVENAEIFQALNDSVQFITNEDGERDLKFVSKSNIVTSLDKSALAAAKKIIFEPAELDGEPVKVKMNVPFDFKLK